MREQLSLRSRASTPWRPHAASSYPPHLANVMPHGIAAQHAPHTLKHCASSVHAVPTSENGTVEHGDCLPAIPASRVPDCA